MLNRLASLAMSNFSKPCLVNLISKYTHLVHVFPIYHFLLHNLIVKWTHFRTSMVGSLGAWLFRVKTTLNIQTLLVLTAHILKYKCPICPVETEWPTVQALTRNMRSASLQISIIKISFCYSSTKAYGVGTHMLWVIKRIVLMRRFFWAPKTKVEITG